MSEPFFIAQTFEPKHVESTISRLGWWAGQEIEARSLGGTFPRYAISEDGRGLLFECWKDRPKDQGEPRWQMTKDAPE